MRIEMRRAAALGICALALIACAVNPATGKRQLALIGEQQEIQLGLEADRDVVASMGVYDDPALGEYVAGIGRSLAAASERPDLEWTFRVADDPMVNAFALPGGFIYITRGILAYMENEAELASVVGHEIGHVTARHSVSQISKAQLAQLGVVGGVILVPEAAELMDLAQTGLGLLFLKFSRDDERQADDLGLRYLVRGGYDPREMPGVFAMLRRTSEAQGGERVPGWLSTHPDPENREARLGAAVTGLGPVAGGSKVGRDAFLDRIDGMVFGPDPREGYFVEQRFLHPEMRFRLEFPAGWACQNDRQAVTCLGPQKDAVVVLTLAAEPDAAAALEAFLAREGLTRGAAGPTSIHGLRARSSEFAVETAEGRIAGQVAFVELDERVFGLLGYAVESSWVAQRRAIAASLASFARLTDPAALAAEPQRLKIVAARGATDLARLAAEHGATAPLETLSLLNGIEPGARIEAGRRVKLVVGGRTPG